MINNKGNKDKRFKKCVDHSSMINQKRTYKSYNSIKHIHK